MNIEEEVRNGYTVTVTAKRLWNIQIEMLKYLLDVCAKHDLKIWAEGGTLLGAIRDKGFIPWDDDIDMMMLRDDYEKLLEIAHEEFQYPLFFQAPSTDPGYIRGHAQLRRSDTAAILPKDIDQSFNQGAFIDIFVFDFLPQTEEERISTFSNLEDFRRRLVRRNYLVADSFKSWVLKWIDALYYKKHGFFHKYKEMEELITRYPNKSDHLIGDVLWTSTNYTRYTREIEWYRDTIMVPFEDIYIPVPVDYHQVLSRQYGDYMTPSKAPSQHGTLILDLDRPYTKVLKELRSNQSIKKRLIKLISPRTEIN